VIDPFHPSIHPCANIYTGLTTTNVITLRVSQIGPCQLNMATSIALSRAHTVPNSRGNELHIHASSPKTPMPCKTTSSISGMMCCVVLYYLRVVVKCCLPSSLISSAFLLCLLCFGYCGCCLLHVLGHVGDRRCGAADGHARL
jgi:hypothetical protein